MDFQAILLEGLFFLAEEPYPDSNGQVRPEFKDLLVQTPGGDKKSVYAALQPLVGQRVYVAAHHVPSNPVDPTKWGGGSCFWQPAARCPFGHHVNPHSLYNLTAEGTLVYDLDFQAGAGGWWVHGNDGGRHMLPWAVVLPGHTGRVAAATAMSVEQMRDSVLASGVNVEGLGERATELRDLVVDLGKVVKGNR